MKAMKIGDRTFDVALNDDLRLQTTVDGQTVTALDKAELQELVANRLRATKASYDIWVVIRMDRTYEPEKPAYVRAVIRGRHARTRSVLLTIGGEKIDLQSPNIIARDRDVSDADLAELNRLAEVERLARITHAKYAEKFGDARGRMRLNVDQLMKDADEAEEATTP